MGNEKEKEMNISDGQETEQFRGALIHVAANGKYGLELKDNTLMEAYGAISLIREKLRKQLDVE